MTEKDHKRKAVAIAPATVTVQGGCITVVVPDVLGKNASHVQSKNGGRRISRQTEAYRESVEQGAKTIVSQRPIIVACAWRLEVVGVWPTQHGKIKGRPVGFVCPVGDADAAIPQALDALQHAGILDDDARVVEVRAWNLYRKGVRATVMRLARVNSVSIERDLSIAHLLPLVPPAVEPPPKPAKSRRKVKATGLPRCPECGGSHSSQTGDPKGFGCKEDEL